MALELEQPLRNRAQREARDQRALRMVDVPREIPVSEFPTDAACVSFLTTAPGSPPPAPAPAILYTQAGSQMVLNSLPSDLTPAQRFGVLKCLKRPNGIKMLLAGELDAYAANRTRLLAVTDKVRGLRLGADDYVVKPFGVAELLARVDAALRRKRTNEIDNAVVQVGDASVDFGAHTITRDGGRVEVTALEMRLLRFFVRHEGV